jgi:hypothetical protein
MNRDLEPPAWEAAQPRGVWGRSPHTCAAGGSAAEDASSRPKADASCSSGKVSFPLEF